MLKRVSSAAQSGTATFPRSELIYTIPAWGAGLAHLRGRAGWGRGRGAAVELSRRAEAGGSPLILG